MSRSHNITGCEAIFERGWDARADAFSPAHGSIRFEPRKRRALPILAFAAGIAATLIAAAFLATH